MEILLTFRFMKLTREQAEEEFTVHYCDLRDALAQEGERINKTVEWQSYLQTKINANELRPEAMHWTAPRITAAMVPVADFG